ncbi:MAG: RHS repeat-associated core domain-containing protein [Anaerolineaceae bacterium]|nr:RHS repeat-associated core domain-containing protein [Anaerolineaceae bacterium]
MTASYTYDGDGVRVKAVVNGVTTHYIGNYFEKIINGATTTVKKYYYASGTRVAMSDNGVIRYFVTDHLGSTTKLINTDGSEYSDMLYAERSPQGSCAAHQFNRPERSEGMNQRCHPWGLDRLTPPGIGTSFKYTGQRQAEAGLYFYNARWYDPEVGRFIQADTIIPEPGVPLAWDRYAYGYNNPVKYTDPSGHNPRIPPKERDDYVPPKYVQMYWRNKTEGELAGYQQSQKGNSCAFNSIASGINMLSGSNINGNKLSTRIDMGWVPPYGLFFRTAPNWATLPVQQSNIVNFGPGIPNTVTADSSKSNSADLVDDLFEGLQDPNSVLLLTLYWGKNQAPQIMFGSPPKDYNSTQKAGGHTMVLAAYDESHQINGADYQWGFINSWGLNTNLSWMSTQDLQDAYYGTVTLTNK